MSVHSRPTAALRTPSAEHAPAAVGVPTKLGNLIRQTVTSRNLVDAAVHRGADPHDCLRDTGVMFEDLHNRHTELCAHDEIAIARNIIRTMDNTKGLGIDAGMRYNIADSGAFGFALLASETMNDAIAVVEAYPELAAVLVRIQRIEGTALTTIEFDANDIPTDVRNLFIERDMTIIANLAPLMITSRLPLDTHISLELPDTALPLELLKYPKLAMTLDTQSSRAAITVPRSILERPMPAADPATLDRCLHECRDNLAQRIRSRGLASQIRIRMLRDPGQLPDIRTVSSEYAITPRTLHRRLATENTTFRDLRNEVRQTLAHELLDDGLTVEATAERLGYADPVSFTHAYKRWFGHPPSARQQKAPPEERLT